MEGLFALVIAGGRGTRFWPLSRRARPKQCLEMGDSDSALVETVERLRPIVPVERILVVTGRDMEAAVRDCLPDLPAENVIVEPWGRNTAPCIALGAIEVGKRKLGAVMAVFPADHHIGAIETFQSAVVAGAQAAKATNSFVTIGVPPTRPETGFGYLELGADVGDWNGFTLKNVDRFREKPGPVDAAAFLESGAHLWNTGIFIFTVDGIRDAFRRFLPRTSEAMEKVAQNPETLQAEWGNMDATSIDYGIMERCRHIYTVPCDLEWSDLGTWPAAGETFPRIKGGRGVVNGSIATDSKGCVIYAPDKTVALIGVEGLVVVDTEDALLVMQSDRAAEVADTVRELEALGLDELT